MRAQAPFYADDLDALDGLLEDADVITLRQTLEGQTERTIALRHDVDNRFDPCLELSQWEADRGYAATYFVLHDAPYWDDPDLRDNLERIADLGHEIALHTNAITVALQTGRCPHEIVAGALDRLRYWGHDVVGMVAHGDPLCYAAKFVNDETFLECARPDWGSPARVLSYAGRSLTLEPRSLASFGLEYCANRLPRKFYMSDSGGLWSQPFDMQRDMFRVQGGPLHILMHPCWWVDAFAGVPV